MSSPSPNGVDDWKDLCTHVETISLSLFGSKGGSSSKHNIIEHKSYLAQDCGRNGLANKNGLVKTWRYA